MLVVCSCTARLLKPRESRPEAFGRILEIVRTIDSPRPLLGAFVGISRSDLESITFMTFDTPASSRTSGFIIFSSETDGYPRIHISVRRPRLTDHQVSSVDEFLDLALGKLEAGETDDAILTNVRILMKPKNRPIQFGPPIAGKGQEAIVDKSE